MDVAVVMLFYDVEDARLYRRLIEDAGSDVVSVSSCYVAETSVGAFLAVYAFAGFYQ